MSFSADTGYIVIAELHIDPAQYKHFLEAIRSNAAASVATEPGCQHFEVVEYPADHRVTLMECYSDKSCFERHRQSSHFLTWKTLASGWISSRDVKHLSSVD